MPTADGDAFDNKTLAALDVLKSYKTLAESPSRRSRLLKDTAILNFLVLQLDQHPAVITAALEVLRLLTIIDQHAVVVSSVFGVQQALINIITESDNKFGEHNKKVATEMYDRLSACADHKTAPTAQASVSDTDTDNKPLQQHNKTSSSSSRHLLPVRQPVKNIQNTFKPLTASSKTNPVKAPRFMAIGSAARAKTHTFELHGDLNLETRSTVEQALLKIRGVISIYFDSMKSRCIVRAKMDVQTDKLALAIVDTDLFDVGIVTKDDYGQEIVKRVVVDDKGDLNRSTRSNVSTDHDLSGYLNESFGNQSSPEQAANERRIARPNQRRCGDDDNGWLGAVSSFVSNSFFW